MGDPLMESRWQDWEHARRSAFIQDVLGAFTRRPADLLPFDKVQKTLRLCNARYLGVLDVPLDHIIGSVGRYRDFTRAFSPRQSNLQERWRRINQLIAKGGGLPPIELYKVGDAYFVRDGHHRVSVAHQTGQSTIEAHVWEYQTRVPIGPDTDLGDLMGEGARAAFLEHTNADHLCPGFDVKLTQPDGYDELLYEIEVFQQVLSTIDEREMPFDEAVVLWYEMQYTPIVDIIRQRNILQEFPGRTEADLYLWLRRSQEELDTRYGHQVLMEEAADDLAERFGERPTPARHVRQAVERLAEGVGELGGRFVESITVPNPEAEETDVIASALMAPIRRVTTATPAYRFQGETVAEWETWRAEFRQRLWDLLGVGDVHPAWEVPDVTGLKAQVEDRTYVAGGAGDGEDHGGVWRELVWLNTEEDLRVPVYLLVPANTRDEPSPAVVIFPGHGTIAQTAGLEKSYQQANALELARAGFVTLTVEPRGFGRLDAIGHLRIDTAARLVGRTWYGLLAQDGMRAMDYLLARPEVDAARIGAAGIGAGGALAMYVAALDDRIQVTMVNSYLSKYAIVSLDEQQCPCTHIPGILPYAEMGDVAALIAPRPVLFVNGLRDPATSPAARESFAIVHQMYRFLGKPRSARLIEPEELGHYFENQLAIGWFRRWLA
jgi:fermentation-respiration switch protein FrsA (DUF1100 family)